MGYDEEDLARKSVYDLVHFDDLSYVASAHQECKCIHTILFLEVSSSMIYVSVLKTGASGMICYRLQHKDGDWQWLQTSSRLVYKNSKPDFIMSTHRPLM